MYFNRAKYMNTSELKPPLGEMELTPVQLTLAPQIWQH
jgi:hypothetical protein